MKTLPSRILLKIIRLPALLLLVSICAEAQPPLDQYIEDGLKSNVVLQQKNLSYEQAEQSLQIAKTYFMPTVSLLADYTSGVGGRSISLPVGDLLNPVYASLNKLTQSDAFPHIENVKQNFFPKNFYDAKVRTSMPLVNTDIIMNRTIQSQQVMLKQFEIDAYKRQLVLDIKTAYFQYLSAISAIRIHESAVELVDRNVTVNESLLKNGKSLPAYYLRAKSEAEQVKANLNSAKNQALNAQKYFNFLLNRDLTTAIDTNYILIDEPSSMDQFSSTTRREELKMLEQAVEINHSTVKLNQLSRLPKLNAFLDLGSQAYNWKYNNDSRYYLVGVQFSLPLFQGFRTQMNIKQGKLAMQQATLSLDNANRQLQLSTEIAQNELQTAIQNFLASRDQLTSARSYFNLIEKGYAEGVNSQIEFLDARNQLTTAQLQQNLRQFDVLIASAKVERETASYTLEK